MGTNADKQASLEAQAKINSRWIHRGKFLSLRQDEIDFPNGVHQTWDIVVHKGAVAIIPLTASGEVILVEQFRRAIGRITLEIPAGLLDPDETPLACAQRELQEETGFKAGSLSSLGCYYSSPGAFTEKIHLFIAKDLTESRLIADDTDQIDVHILSLEAALKLVGDGTICDAKTALALLMVGQKCSE